MLFDFAPRRPLLSRSERRQLFPHTFAERKATIVSAYFRGAKGDDCFRILSRSERRRLFPHTFAERKATIVSAYFRGAKGDNSARLFADGLICKETRSDEGSQRKPAISFVCPKRRAEVYSRNSSWFVVCFVPFVFRLHSLRFANAGFYINLVMFPLSIVSGGNFLTDVSNRGEEASRWGVTGGPPERAAQSGTGKAKSRGEFNKVAASARSSQ